jgi:hypothetical protein
MPRVIPILIFMLALTACTSAPAATSASPQSLSVNATGTPLASPTSIKTSTPEATSTLAATSTPIGPTPTETALPTLELPTEPVKAPNFMVWDGVPTYPGDSQPGFMFRVKYDPEVWGLTTDNFGSPALGHRAIATCIISPAAGRGLPMNMTVEHDTRRIGSQSFDVNTAYLNGVEQFVTYLGGDANVYTGFEVDFQENADQCVKDAEAVISTLTSVPVSQATPAP